MHDTLDSFVTGLMKKRLYKGMIGEVFFIFSIFVAELRRKQTDDRIYNFQTAVRNVTVCTCVRVHEFPSTLIVKT